MACHGYLQLEGRSFLIEYIVRNCIFPLTMDEDHKSESTKTDSTAAPTADVRIMCRNILNAFSSTIEGMDEVKIRKFYFKLKNIRSIQGFMAIINGIFNTRNLYWCIWNYL